MRKLTGRHTAVVALVLGTLIIAITLAIALMWLQGTTAVNCFVAGFVAGWAIILIGRVFRHSTTKQIASEEAIFARSFVGKYIWLRAGLYYVKYVSREVVHMHLIGPDGSYFPDNMSVIEFRDGKPMEQPYTGKDNANERVQSAIVAYRKK